MSVIPFVHSSYDRIENDNYQTIDERCIKALFQSWRIEGSVVDCCAPTGSGIVDTLLKYKINARGEPNAFRNFDADWIVTNPPYKRGIVDDIANLCVDKVETGKIKGAALLVRSNWDFAMCRSNIFNSNCYAAQIKMRFRPWWTEDRVAQPIHNFVWHVWQEVEHDPIVKYWPIRKAG